MGSGGPYEVGQPGVFLTERHCRNRDSPSDEGSGSLGGRLEGERASRMAGSRRDLSYELLKVVRGSSGEGSVRHVLKWAGDLPGLQGPRVSRGGVSGAGDFALQSGKLFLNHDFSI